MIYVTNQDKPGFIGRFGGLLGDAGVNIATFNLGRDAQGGSAIALVEVDGEVPPPVLDAHTSHRGREAGQGAAVSERHVVLNENRPGTCERSGGDFRWSGRDYPAKWIPVGGKG